MSPTQTSMGAEMSWSGGDQKCKLGTMPGSPSCFMSPLGEVLAFSNPKLPVAFRSGSGELRQGKGQVDQTRASSNFHCRKKAAACGSETSTDLENQGRDTGQGRGMSTVSLAQLGPWLLKWFWRHGQLGSFGGHPWSS